MSLKFTGVVLLLSIVICQLAYATPRLAFSDLVNGPVQGLGDGLGQGAIVTVWGYKLGDTPGKIFFEDSTGTQKQAAHVYYWKKADGKLPGGPANLFKSHQLYEIAFSLPTTTLGTGKILVQHSDGSYSNFLPFNAVAGRIFHIKSNGDNLNDGSFANPWKFLNGDDNKIPSAGNGKLSAGDVVYFHGTTERLGEYVGSSTRAAIFLRSINGRADAHVGISSYPGTQALVESPTAGILPYLSSGILVSKFTVKGGLIDDKGDDGPIVPPASPSTAQIMTTANGRIVANAITDLPGKCSNGYAGAVTGGQADADNVSIIGNEIYDIGCRQTSHFHHTTYMTRRSQTGAAPISAGEFAWNYLHDNMAKYGIHYYDQSNSSSKPCDQITGTLKIHNNYIINQRSTAISVNTENSFKNEPCWKIDTHIYNNIIVKSGLGPVAEISNGTQPYALNLGGGIAGSFRVFNNLILSVSDTEGRMFGAPAVVSFNAYKNMTSLSFINNIVQPNFDMDLVHGDSAEVRANIISPSDANSIFQIIFGQTLTRKEKYNYFTESIISLTPTISIELESKVNGKGIIQPELLHDFYGNAYNEQSPAIGPIQYD